MVDAPSASPGLSATLGFPPPRTVLIRGLQLAFLILIPTVALYLFAGPTAATIALVALTGAPIVPVMAPRVSLGLYAGLACVAAIATAWHLQLWPITILVGLAAVATGIASTISASAFTGAPAIAMILGGNDFAIDPALAAILTFVVGAYLVFLVTAMKLKAPAQPVPIRQALIHAGVMGLFCGVAAWAYLQFSLPHGYWLVLTLAMILRPTVRETANMTRDRVLGTIVGALIAAIVTPLPVIVLLLFTFACLVMVFSYALLSDFLRTILFTTPMVLILASIGGDVNALNLTAERLLWTVIGCAIGGGVALAMAHFESRVSSSDGAG